MRGALDGLAAVPPYGDPDYAGLRRELALKAPGTPGGALPLNGFFGLHPSLGFLHDSYTSRELLVFHAIASPYRDRSHFDGQDVLENGSLQPHAVQTGWLNRGLASLQAGNGKDLGVALGQNIPLVMRGPASVTSWSPSKLAALDDDTLERITDLYAGDPLLASRLADALSADAIANASKPLATSARTQTRCNPLPALRRRNRAAMPPPQNARCWQQRRCRRHELNACKPTAATARETNALHRGGPRRSRLPPPRRRPASGSV